MKTAILNNVEFYENDAIYKHLLKGNIWEPDFIAFTESFIQPGDICIDVGGHIGISTLQMYKAGAGTVHTFEPNMDLYPLLVNNITRNVKGNVGRYCYNIAVGSETKKVGMEQYNKEDNWVNFGKYSVTGGETIQMIKLDDFELGQIKAIKLDCQGNEFNVLKGAEHLLKLNKPYIFIELEEVQLNKFNTTVLEIKEYLGAMGYFVYSTETTPFTNHIAVNQEIIKRKKSYG